MISVCMATYNGQKYIREQIDSILSQLGQEDELVISDDASTDSTLEIIGGYGDKRIKLYPFVRNKSAYKKSAQLVTTNFEHALQHAKGDFIFLSDQDDVWLPGKVEKCLEALRQADLVVHDCRVADAELDTVCFSYFSLIHVQGGFIHNFIKVKYLGCCMAFRREVLTAALPMKPYIAHDTWICLLAELLFKTRRLPVQLSLYRRHGDNMSSASEKSPYPLWYKIYYRIPIFFSVIGRSLFYRLKTVIGA